MSLLQNACSSWQRQQAMFGVSLARSVHARQSTGLAFMTRLSLTSPLSLQFFKFSLPIIFYQSNLASCLGSDPVDEALGEYKMNFFLSSFIFIVLPTCLLILAACVKQTRKSRVSKRILPTIYSSFGLHNPKNKQCFCLLCFVEKKKTSPSKCWSVALLPATDKKLSDGDCLTGFTGLAACLGFPLTGDHICCAAKYIAGIPTAQCMVNNCRTMR